MKKLVKVIGVLAVLGVLALGYIWFFVYNKPHRDFEKAKADYSLSADECYQHFAAGSDGDNGYTGKVLEISGSPSLVESNDSMVVLAFVFSEGMFGDEGIRCTMLPTYSDQTLALSMDKNVTVKGFCAGYNGTDVVLEQCSIVKK